MPPPNMSSATESGLKYEDIQKLDLLLGKWNLKRVRVPDDGNCFFHAVCGQLSTSYPWKAIDSHSLRADSVEFLRHNVFIEENTPWTKFLAKESRDAYLSRMAKLGEWVDHIMIKAAACVIKCDITIVTTTNENPICITPQNGASDGHIVVGHVAEIHYFGTEQAPTAPASYDDMSPLRGRRVSMREASKLPLGGGHVEGKTGILKPERQPSRNKPKKHTVFTEEPFSNHKNSTELVKKSKEDSVGQGSGSESPPSTPSPPEPVRTPSASAEMPGYSNRPQEDDQFWKHQLGDTEPEEAKGPSLPEFPLEPPPDDANDGGKVLHFFTKLAKYVSTLIFAGAVLFGALTEKSTLLVLANSYSAAQISNHCEPWAEYQQFMVLMMFLTMLCFPEFLTFVYSLYKIIFKKEKKLDWAICLKGAIPEVISAIGLTLLVVGVVPWLDATLAILMFSLVALVPTFIHLHAKVSSVTHTKSDESPSIRQRRKINLGLCITALILQLGGYGLLCWQIYVQSSKDKRVELCILAGVSLLATSCRYWENFVSMDFVFTKTFKIPALVTQTELDRMRFKTGFIYSFLRMGFMVATCFFVYYVIDGRKHPANFGQHVARAQCSDFFTSLWFALLANALCSLGTFYFARIACMTMVQVQAYSFPLMMVTPLMAALTASFNMLHGNESLMQFFGMGDKYHEFTVQNINWRTNHYSTTEIIFLVIVGLAAGWLALLLITWFLWKPKQDRLERTEVLFVKPIYSGPLINETLMMNRRQYPNNYIKSKKSDEQKEMERFVRNSSRRSSSRRRRFTRRMTMANQRKFVPQVFLCATMWHETEQEMTQLLTSIMRLDKDQGNRRKDARKDPDYYNFQVHVLFDDAMDLLPLDGKLQSKPNKFVQQLIRLIPVAANKVDLGEGDKMCPPVIYPAPYGGRLEFILPHGNMMIVHLKDKTKIRHRKRWSQCMYMYYILGYLQMEKKAFKMEDIFILALDGDVDFQPGSLLLLLDRMKRNPDVGAACGRIHPIGNGPVVWFQKFEYAVGHWLQKTAEHVIGCVLCSPGCFSLFRGEAIADTNVVAMYTTKASEALHYIQWDQGEDRWLCTLLLKQGWRIEYSAASDSYTYAPEAFKEFYNQRRRWGPSTMANVFDILLNAKLTVKNNDYISWGYISYQMGLMASSILGPATVVLVVQGAFAYVFNMSAIGSLMIALIPVVIFVILCYTTSQDFQVAVAGILTIIYALVMMAVLVGIIGQMSESLLNPNSLFMIAMIAIYAFTGIIHPTEMMCLIHGLLYYLCVPSAFILLMVYSLCNMNNVSWGTREVKPVVVDSDAQEQALKEIADKTKAKTGRNLQLGPTVYDSQPGTSADGYYSCGLGNLCQCALCIQPKPAYQPVPTAEPVSAARRKSTFRSVTGAERKVNLRKYSVAKSQFDKRPVEEVEKSLNRRVSVAQFREMLQKNEIKDLSTAGLRRRSQYKREAIRKQRQSVIDAKKLHKEVEEDEERRRMGVKNQLYDSDSDPDDYADEERMKEEEGEGLYWIIDESMGDGQIAYMDDREHLFWREFIRQYLQPLDENKAEQDRIRSDLIELRNKMTGAYFLINSLWIVLTFSLTLAIQDINITFYDSKGNEIVLQPLAFLFLIFFIVILFIQFTTMLIHRWSTFVHLLAVTTFDWTDRRDKQKNTAEEKELPSKPVEPRPRLPPDNSDMESGSVIKNPVYKDNFSYDNNEKPPKQRYSRASEVDECNSDSGSDAYENPDKLQFRQQGSLMLRENGSLVKSLGATGVVGPRPGVDEEEPYAEISLDRNDFPPGGMNGYIFDAGPPVLGSDAVNVGFDTMLDDVGKARVDVHGSPVSAPRTTQPKSNGNVRFDTVL